MTVEIVEVSSCKKSLSVEIPAQEVDEEVSKIAREYSRNIKVAGFRPGKVPMSIIRQRFGNDLMKDATQNLIERCWKDALEEHKIKPLSPPQVKDVTNTPGAPLKFTVSFEVLPPLEVKDYKGVPVTLPPATVSDDDVSKTLDTLRENNAQFVPVEGEARDGLYLTITVDGQFEGSAKPMHEEDVTLIVGHAQTNAEFSENLRGAKTGETRTFEVNYPADYHRKGFAGKKVSYTVLVKDIKEKQLAELNDDFAKDMGADSLDALKSRVYDDLVTQAKQVAEKKARETLLDSLVQRQTVEIPECLVNEELESQANRIASNLAYQGVDINQASIDWKKIFEEERPRAEQAVRRSLFLGAIARQEGIEVAEDEVNSELQKYAEGTGKSAAALRAQLEKEERIQSFEDHLRQNKALDFIYRNANITEG
ncbi:MAG TPA: trigger factor [Acidobacteriota bacterium]|nr:trigger factor [Acidobacteriota bacterium]